jgi:EAL domain-containing protein (putative c-di-GMP-specific phosphodiesterase class I)
LKGTLTQAVEGAGLTPHRITVEVTETGLARNAGLVLQTVGELRDLGCEVAIDDFGSGYSSLSRLERLPADVLKVDAAFARDLHVSPSASAIISAVLLLGRSLGRTVVVEGVEDESTVQTLIDLGCTHLQGYQLGRPMSAGDLESMLTAPDSDVR